MSTTDSQTSGRHRAPAHAARPDRPALDPAVAQHLAHQARVATSEVRYARTRRQLGDAT